MKQLYILISWLAYPTLDASMTSEKASRAGLLRRAFGTLADGESCTIAVSTGSTECASGRCEDEGQGLYCLPSTGGGQGTLADGSTCATPEECASGRCEDAGVGNGLECLPSTGGSQGGAPDGSTCATPEECASGRCEDEGNGWVCLPPTGGSQGGAPDGSTCATPEECASGRCEDEGNGWVCLPPTDQGGAAAGSTCATPGECASGRCEDVGNGLECLPSTDEEATVVDLCADKCNSNGACEPSTGECTCNSSHKGIRCEEKVPDTCSSKYYQHACNWKSQRVMEESEYGTHVDAGRCDQLLNDGFSICIPRGYDSVDSPCSDQIDVNTLPANARVKFAIQGGTTAENVDATNACCANARELVVKVLDEAIGADAKEAAYTVLRSSDIVSVTTGTVNCAQALLFSLHQVANDLEKAMAAAVTPEEIDASKLALAQANANHLITLYLDADYDFQADRVQHPQGAEVFDTSNTECSPYPEKLELGNQNRECCSATQVILDRDAIKSGFGSVVTHCRADRFGQCQGDTGPASDYQYLVADTAAYQNALAYWCGTCAEDILLSLHNFHHENSQKPRWNGFFFEKYKGHEEGPHRDYEHENGVPFAAACYDPCALPDPTKTGIHVLRWEKSKDQGHVAHAVSKCEGTYEKSSIAQGAAYHDENGYAHTEYFTLSCELGVGWHGESAQAHSPNAFCAPKQCPPKPDVGTGDVRIWCSGRNVGDKCVSSCPQHTDGGFSELVRGKHHWCIHDQSDGAFKWLGDLPECHDIFCPIEKIDVVLFHDAARLVIRDPVTGDVISAENEDVTTRCLHASKGSKTEECGIECVQGFQPRGKFSCEDGAFSEEPMCISEMDIHSGKEHWYFDVSSQISYAFTNNANHKHTYVHADILAAAEKSLREVIGKENSAALTIDNISITGHIEKIRVEVDFRVRFHEHNWEGVEKWLTRMRHDDVNILEDAGRWALKSFLTEGKEGDHAHDIQVYALNIKRPLSKKSVSSIQLPCISETNDGTTSESDGKLPHALGKNPFETFQVFVVYRDWCRKANVSVTPDYANKWGPWCKQWFGQYWEYNPREYADFEHRGRECWTRLRDLKEDELRALDSSDECYEYATENPWDITAGKNREFDPRAPKYHRDHHLRGGSPTDSDYETWEL